MYAAQKKALMNQTVLPSRSNLRTASQVSLMPLTQIFFFPCGQSCLIDFVSEQTDADGFQDSGDVGTFADRRNNLTSGPRGLHLLPERPSQGGYQTTEVEE